MTRIGLLSDTHGYIDKAVLDFFKDCNQIWHAGDIGDIEVIEKLQTIAPVTAVYGNIDGNPVRTYFKENARFLCEETDVWLTHIGGYPNHYDLKVKHEILLNPPALFICGHSHILKVMYDKKLELLHINPGAAGKSGWHKVRTAIRFTIEGKQIDNLEILEMKR